MRRSLRTRENESQLPERPCPSDVKCRPDEELRVDRLSDTCNGFPPAQAMRMRTNAHAAARRVSAQRTEGHAVHGGLAADGVLVARRTLGSYGFRIRHCRAAATRSACDGARCLPRRGSRATSGHHWSDPDCRTQTCPRIGIRRSVNRHRRHSHDVAIAPRRSCADACSRRAVLARSYVLLGRSNGCGGGPAQHR